MSIRKFNGDNGKWAPVLTHVDAVVGSDGKPLSKALEEMDNKIITSASGQVTEDGGEPSVDITVVDGVASFDFKNIKGDTGATGLQGPQGDSAVYDPSSPDTPDFEMANSMGGSTTKSMTQKAVTESVTLEKEINLSALTKYNYMIVNGLWTTYTSGDWVGCKLITTTGGEIYKIAVNDVEGQFTDYAFLSSNIITKNATPGWADGVTGITRLQRGESATIIAPSDAIRLYILVRSNKVDLFPQVVKLDKLKNKVAKAEEEIREIQGNLDVEKAVSMSVQELQYWISGSQWKYDSTNKGKSKNIPIKAGKTYRIAASSDNYTTFSFLANNNNISDGQTPGFAEGVTERTIVGEGTSQIVIAPSNALWLNVMTRSSGTALNPTVTEFVTLKDSLSGSQRTIRERLQRVTLDVHTGSYAYGEYPKSFSTAKLYRKPLDGVVKMSFSVDASEFTFYVFGYDADQKYVGYRDGLQAADGEMVEVNMEVGWEFFKVVFALNQASTLTPDIVDVLMEGNFAADYAHYNMPQGSPDVNGNWMIPLTLVIDTPVLTSQDSEAAEVTDLVNSQYDHGLLALPSSYTAEGEPTRLIIYCHGAGKHYTQGTSVFSNYNGASGLDPTYWLSEGYAVMDMDGLPNETTVDHWRVPSSYQCYYAAYKHVIDNYNICKDGVFVGGWSMGATMSLMILAYAQIPVLACCPFAPPGPWDLRRFYEWTKSNKERLAADVGIYNPNNIEWPDAAEPLPLELICMEYATVNGHEKYIGNFERLMQFNPAYRLIVNIPSKETLTQDSMFSIQFNSQAWFEFAKGLYGNCIIKTKVPVKFFGAYNDATVPYQAVNLWARMFRNGGCIIEQRMFPTGDHTFDKSAANKVSEFVNSKGVTLTNVPIPYIEALQFWRNYE